MRIKVLPQFLLRAPLFPVAALGERARDLFRDPLAAQALALASPDLIAHGKGAAGERAVRRFARRAAFRATPHGLWSGVCVGELAARTAIRTGPRRAHVEPAWRVLAALGREMLDDAEVRVQVRLRRTPSLLRRGDRAMWLAHGDDDAPHAEAREVDLDALLHEVLDATGDWTDWAGVRRAAESLGSDVGANARGALDGSAGATPRWDGALLRDVQSIDEWLLMLVDDGLLLHDLTPPLIGPPPVEWMTERLLALAPPRRLDATDGPRHAILVHEPTAVPTISRPAVERAAALAPLLFRLQQALSPPAAERDLDSGLAAAVDAVTETFGAGALDLAALALGDYGVPLHASATPAASVPPAALLALIVERLATGDHVIAFGGDELDALLPPAAPPPTFELFLTPAREPRGALPGTGWLLGLHAPAGASWGRFARAIGAPLDEPLAALAAAEAAARPGEETLDLAYAPSWRTADLVTHAPVRARALALTSWPADALALDELAIVSDGAHPLALRGPDGPLAPSPLGRVRSTTTDGIYRLLVGARLYRQHAPWAVHLGVLGGLARLPRVVIDGFVVAPASWRVPADVAAGDRAALRRWRRDARVPRHVQIGHEDELLLVDLDDRDAPDELARLMVGPEPPRAFEIWPPLNETLDRGGRRLEAVIAAVVEDPAAADDIAVAAAAGPVPRPGDVEQTSDGWRTFKLFGAGDRADHVLTEAVAPAVAAALADGTIDAWFFLRYIDPPGPREHLRLRVHAGRRALFRFETSLREALVRPQAACDVVAIEVADYFPERARYGEAALPTVERIFESDSTLVLALIAAAAGATAAAAAASNAYTEADTTELMVRSIDALTTGLGLTLAQRAALARRRRAAHEDLLRVPGEKDPLAAEHRVRGRHLAAALRLTLTDPAAEPLAAHVSRLRALPPLSKDDRERILPALLHMAAVRLAGPDRHAEARAYYFWQRTLESLVARR